MPSEENTGRGSTDGPLWSDASNTRPPLEPAPPSSFENHNINSQGNQTERPTPATPVITGEDGSIESLVNAAVINVDAPCENIPLLRPQELKIIGRCVTFSGETTVEGRRVLLHYEGIVAMISKDTVMLLHVNRFTDEDFIKHQEEVIKEELKEAQRNKPNRENNDDTELQNQEEKEEEEENEQQQQQQQQRQRKQKIEARDSLNGHSNSKVESSNAVTNGNNQSETNVIDCFLPDSQNANANSSETLIAESDSTRQARVLGEGSIGPVPYMTFSRRRIHNVVFGRDPRSSFYSIFQDPSKRNFDMQCLRMFIRRYLVHTSQGNNPRNIFLRPFVMMRSSCKNIDNELLISVAKEELANLIKTERAIVKASENSANNRRNAFNAYRPPSGLFSGTGILFLTRIPVQTFCLAILEMLVTVLLLSFSAYSFAAAPPVVIYGYVKTYTFSVTIAGIITLLASAVTAFHSLKMRLPLTFTLYGILRFILATVGIGLNTMVLVMVGEAVSFSHIQNYLFNLAGESMELCQYYTMYDCTGFGEVCEPGSLSPICMWDWCPSNRTNTCNRPLTNSFTRVFIPIVVFSMVLIALLVIDHFLHYRLIQISRLLMAQM